jgi:DNA-binding response OmpR family regulator
LGSDWRNEGANSMLVKPMNTNDLLRQIEALLVSHEDTKQAKVVRSENGEKRQKTATRQAS